MISRDSLLHQIVDYYSDGQVNPYFVARSSCLKLAAFELRPIPSLAFLKRRFDFANRMHPFLEASRGELEFDNYSPLVDAVQFEVSQGGNVVLIPHGVSLPQYKLRELLFSERAHLTGQGVRGL